MDYVRLSRSFVNNELLPSQTSDIWNRIKEHPNKDHYISLYNYKDHHVKRFAETRSVEGITDVTTNQLLWDFDSRKLEDAQQDTQELCNRLLEQGVPEDKIQVFFSGNKGFHVQLMINENLTRQQFRNITFNLAKGITTFDVRINDEPRVIRAPLTKHPESGLYKIPITLENLNTLSIGDIKVMASDIKDYSFHSTINEKKWRFTLPPEISNLKSIPVDPASSSVKLEDIKGFVEADLDFTQCPKWLSKDRFALKEGYFYGSESVNTGERNIAFMILAATYRNQGFSEDETLSLLEITAQKQAKRTGEDEADVSRLKREVISSVYSPNWKGGIYSSDEPLLVLTRKRFNLEEKYYDKNVEEITDVANGFKSFAKDMQKNRVLVGLESLDKKLVLTTGMVCTVVSAPGGGKTALANLFAETVSKGNENVLYFSLDLYKNLLFGRMLQRHINYDIQKIFSQFENDEVDKDLFEAYSGVLKDYTNVGFSFKTSSIDDIEKEIQINLELKGKTPKLIVVDYLDKVRSPYTDPTQSSAYVVGRLSDIAKKYSTLVLLLAQPSKFGSSGPEQEFKSYRSLKGSSSIESDSRVVLGIHRPGYSPADQSNDLYSSITILKNNTGSLGQLDYSWNGLAGTFTELNIDQRRSLKKLRDDLESKRDKDGDF